MNAIPFADKLGPLVIAIIILVVGLILAKIIRGFVKKALSKVGALNRVNADGSVTDLATPIAMLVYAVIVLFVLMSVLARLGLTDVLDPLKGMASQIVGYIPNIIGAAIVGYVGYIIANIVSDFVGMGLGKADEQLAMRTGNNDIQVSKIGKSFVFAAIILPIAIAALTILDIEAISGPAKAMLEKLMAAIPNIIAAGIILAATYFIAKFIVQILGGILEGMNIDAMPEKLGMSGIFTPTFTPTKLIGSAIMFFAMLTGITAAVDQLNIGIISEIMARVLEFGGGLLIGGVILVIGNFLSMLAHNAISRSSPGMADMARFAILGLVLAMGLKAMGLADNIVNLAFGLTLGALAVAAALAFGFGGRDAAKRIADRFADKIT